MERAFFQESIMKLWEQSSGFGGCINLKVSGFEPGWMVVSLSQRSEKCEFSVVS